MVLKNYLQGRNGETDIENRLMDTGRREERVRCMERVTTPVVSPGESHGQRSLAGYKESDRTERLTLLLS